MENDLRAYLTSQRRRLFQRQTEQTLFISNVLFISKPIGSEREVFMLSKMKRFEVWQ